MAQWFTFFYHVLPFLATSHHITVLAGLVVCTKGRTSSLVHNLWPHRRGQTALHGAAREGHAAVVEKLLSAKAKVDASGFQGHGLRVELYRGAMW